MREQKEKVTEQIKQLEEQIKADKQQLAELRGKKESTIVNESYTFKDKHGNAVKLSELFGDKNELILIQNMGKSCRYCTMWADGFNGLVPHLEDRAAFAVVSPDPPATQQEFAQSRNWQFRLYSSEGSSFKKDFGFETEDGQYLPGVVVFTKEESGKIYHHTQTFFGPGDNYCVTWDLFSLLPTNSQPWEPQYKYT